MKVGLIILDTSSRPQSTRSWLTGYLEAIGVEVSVHELGASDLDRLADILRSNDALVVVGAAGNKAAVSKIAELLGLGVEVNSEALEAIRNYFSDRLDYPENMEEMALMPEFSYVVANERGPVPGFVAFSLTDDKFIAATPPRFEEAVECFERGIQDFFREKTGKRYSVTFVLYAEGPLEGAERILKAAVDGVGGVFARVDGRFLGQRGIPIVFTVYASSPEELSEKMRELEERARKASGEHSARLVEKPEAVGEEDF